MYVIRACVVAVVAVMFALTKLSLAQGAVTVAPAAGQRGLFLPGEPIAVDVELHNGSGAAVVRPLAAEWSVSLVDDSGNAVEDGALPGQPRFWVPPEPGQSAEFSAVEPGETLIETFFLQNRFLVSEDGTYTAVFSVEITEVVPNQPTEPFGPFFTVSSTPFTFQVSSNGVAWHENVGVLFFHVVDQGGGLSLRFYRVMSIGDRSLFSDYTVVGQVAGLSPPPEVNESTPVTARRGRVGVKFTAVDGTGCAVVEVEDDLLRFTPPVLLPGPASACP